MIHEPELLILDEPTIGLDPNQIRQVRDLIRNLRAATIRSCSPPTSSRSGDDVHPRDHHQQGSHRGLRHAGKSPRPPDEGREKSSLKSKPPIPQPPRPRSRPSRTSRASTPTARRSGPGISSRPTRISARICTISPCGKTGVARTDPPRRHPRADLCRDHPQGGHLGCTIRHPAETRVRHYFHQPLAYIVLFCFLLIIGFIFQLGVGALNRAPSQTT